MGDVLDASALLAFLQGEPGAGVVETSLEDGAVCGTANWSEVAQKVVAAGRDWSLVRGLLESYGLVLESVTVADAEVAAGRWGTAANLSLGDRLCLALGDRFDARVITADRDWGTAGRIVQIRADRWVRSSLLTPR